MTNLIIDIVVMAAGKGSRMKSSMPKVLHRLGGKALLAHVMDCADRLSAQQMVLITGHGAEMVEAAVAKMSVQLQTPVKLVRQMPQLGTGHAVQQALPKLSKNGEAPAGDNHPVTLILSGDVPLIETATLQALIAATDNGKSLALLTLHLPDPSGYGRIVRNIAAAQMPVIAIREHKDASPQERQIGEIYSGIMAVPTDCLARWLPRLDNQNAQGEYYLTDIVKMAVADGVPVVGHGITDAAQVAGINDPQQLAELEREYQKRQATALMQAGVRLADPARLDIRGQLTCGLDVEIDVNCVFEGQVELGDQVRIGANCVIANCRMAAGTVVQPFTHIDGGADVDFPGVDIGENARIGPFSRLRPGTALAAEVHIGNFVEVKNSRLAEGAKANHLAYLGDADVGERVNYGAGSITANYDGANKHRTVIEADVHIGSNCVLVAPLTIGAGGTVAAGSTVNETTLPAVLTIARIPQRSIERWRRPVKGQ